MRNSASKNLASARDICLLFLLFAGFFASPAFALSGYDSVVMVDKPILFLNTSTQKKPLLQDISGRKHTARYCSSATAQSLMPLPNRDSALYFNGLSQYAEITNAADLSVTQTGILTIEAWIRPDTLQFSKQEGSGYVYWLGKGEGYGSAGHQEYAARMYSLSNTETPVRPNRISAYLFNPRGGLGSGSYFQDAIIPGRWIYVVAVFNTVNRSAKYPTGYVKLYRDGQLRDQDSLSDYQIKPVHGPAPLRIGTMNKASFFQGGIGKVALYDHELTPVQIDRHYHAMKK